MREVAVDPAVGSVSVSLRGEDRVVRERKWAAGAPGRGIARTVPWRTFSWYSSMPVPARGVVVVLVGGEAAADGLSLLAGPASGTFASHTARALTEAGDPAAAGQLGKGE